MDLEALKARKVKRIFRSWVEAWELECIKENDPVAEIRLLEKYKGLCFWDPVEKMTYTIESSNMEWLKKNKKKDIDGGWYVLAKDDDGDLQSFQIEDELCQQIADTPQDDGIAIMRKEVEEGKSEE